MKKMRFAIVGMGGMGRRWAKVVAEIAPIDAIVSTTLKTMSFSDVLKNERIDAILIAKRHGDLCWMTRDALKAGKHVLCEKPGALASGEIKRNIALAKKMGLVYMVGFNCRFHDGFLRARKMYEQGKIGDIIFIRARYGFGGRKGYDKEWRLNRNMGGSGHLVSQGVHMIDMALSFIGKPKEVKGFTGKVFWGKNNKAIGEDNAFVLLKGAAGEMASIHVSLTQWKPMHNFEIYGTEGYLSIEGLGQRYGGDDRGNERLVFCKRRKDFGRNVKEKIIKCNPVADDSLRHLLKEFLSAIKEKRQPIPSGVEAYNTMRVVEEVYRRRRNDS